MNSGIRGQSPAEALLTALDAYEKWLSDLGEGGCLGLDTRVGIARLQEVLDVRREAFPLLSPEGTELLLAHARIADLVHERQLRALRGGMGDSADDERFAQLAQRQRAAIEALRRALAAWPLAARENASGRVD